MAVGPLRYSILGVLVIQQFSMFGFHSWMFRPVFSIELNISKVQRLS